MRRGRVSSTEMAGWGRQWTAWRWVAGFLVSMASGSAVGCRPPSFQCTDDAACRRGMDLGVCVAPGNCAFEDDACVSGFAYAKLSSSDVAGTCVPTEDASASGSSDPSTSSAAEVTGPSTTVGMRGDDSDTVSTCPAGSACVPTNPCAIEGVCSDESVCVATAGVACEDPPSACVEAVGSCNASGSCEYPPLRAGVECDDHDPCTLGDACDGSGSCVPGPICPTGDDCEAFHCEVDGCVSDGVCPNTDPCIEMTCESGRCQAAPAADGSSCGVEESSRCCGGQCVDISSDTNHCGGCNTACAVGMECESIAATESCPENSPQTSGRCRCQMANAQCPSGQLCRTFSPYTNRCVPENSSQCDGVRITQDSCPPFCTY